MEPAALYPQPARRTRTAEWSAEEKQLVLAKLSTGRKPLMEIVHALNGTKSLRQVAEYIEYLDLWSRMLGKRSKKRPASKIEAKEIGLEQIIQEDLKAAHKAAASDAKAKAKISATKPQSQLFNVKVTWVKRNHLTRGRKVRVADETRLQLGQALRKYIGQILLHAETEAVLMRRNLSADGGVKYVRRENVQAALRALEGAATADGLRRI
ncbi:hypothetical protein IWW51_003983 [Coemansia sp. RSA 2702]|nr:hypothetical protein IWW51_003983 [Coemansia sp. RSA 2702]